VARVPPVPSAAQCSPDSGRGSNGDATAGNELAHASFVARGGVSSAYADDEPSYPYLMVNHAVYDYHHQEQQTTAFKTELKPSMTSPSSVAQTCHQATFAKHNYAPYNMSKPPQLYPAPHLQDMAVSAAARR